jgi:probable phosphoglycerate mutase
MTAAETGEPPTMAPPTRLVLVRHGETEWAMSGRHTGRTDIPLTARGRVQAERLGSVFRRRTFSRVLSSPLARALETCRLAGFGERAEVFDDLREWDYGVYEGRTRVEIAAEIPGWTVWTHPIVGGESLDDVGRRADRVIEAILPSGGDVLIFAHGHILRILAARWIEQPAVLASRLELATAAVSELGWEQDRRTIESWDATPVAAD